MRCIYICSLCRILYIKEGIGYACACAIGEGRNIQFSATQTTPLSMLRSQALTNGVFKGGMQRLFINGWLYLCNHNWADCFDRSRGVCISDLCRTQWSYLLMIMKS